MSIRYKRTNWVRFGRLLPAWLLAGFISSLAFAVPVTTNYQGYLENTDGEPLDATVNMTVALYAAAQGGSALWTETHQNVEVTDGVFSLILGDTTSFDDNSLEGERYLGVTVGSDPEMAPRQQLTSAFFAMRAGVADSVKAASVETEAIADGAVTADKIASESITGDKIANLSGHNVTELDDVADAGSGAIITVEEREKLEGLTPGGNGGSLFQLNGNDAYYTDGNVGIGTTEPQAKLHVDGTIITQKLATKESQKEMVISVGGNNLFKISRTLSTHPDHVGIYERSLELLGPDDNSQELGKTLLYGGIALFGNKRHSSVGIGPYISFNSTFPNPSDNRHFYISLGDTWNNSSVSRDDLIIHSWNNVYKNHIQHIVFKANGNVGIGTISPQYKLDVAGTIRGNNVSPSDQRLKQNIQPLENSLAKVDQLRGVSFEWKDKAQDAGTQIGMIAQEVETVLPELVSTDSEGYKSLAYDKMTAVLLEAVKELKAQNDALKAIVCEDHPEKAICQ